MTRRALDLDPEELRRLIEEEKLTQRAVAERFGCSLSAIERWCKRLGLKTQRTGPRSGAGHTNWKGGRALFGRYWYRWVGQTHPMSTKKGYVAEHRLLMAEHLGRMLHRDEVVHHRDGNPENNDLSNLELFQTNADHLRHELKGRVPKWSPEGRARILAGVKGPHTRRR